MQNGTGTYLYSLWHIAQDDVTGLQYLLGNVLGSVCQLVDDGGAETLANNYRPYGEVLSSVANATSPYGFAGEWTVPHIVSGGGFVHT